MKTHFGSAWPTVSWLTRHLLALTVFWIISDAFVQIGQRALGGWPAGESGQLLACVAGVFIALQLRAPAAAYLLAAMTAFSASELAVHLTYGIRAAQGAPTHLAVIGAGVLGVAFGAWLMRRNHAGSGAGAPNIGAADSPAVSSTDMPRGSTFEPRSHLPLQPVGVRS